MSKYLKAQNKLSEKYAMQSDSAFDELKSASLIECLWVHIYHFCAFFTMMICIIMGFYFYQPTHSLWAFFMAWGAMCIFFSIPIVLTSICLTFLLIPFAFLGDTLIMCYLKKHGRFSDDAQNNYQFSCEMFGGLVLFIGILFAFYYFLF